MGILRDIGGGILFLIGLGFILFAVISPLIAEGQQERGGALLCILPVGIILGAILIWSGSKLAGEKKIIRKEGKN